MSHTSLLSSVEIFLELNDEQLGKIGEICEEKSFGKGETIFAENAPSQEFYIILKGEVEIQLDPNLIRDGGDTHQLRTIATLKRGQSFGEVALVDQGVRSASAKSSSDETRVLILNRDAFIELLKHDIEIGFVVMQNLAADLCFKIRNNNFMIKEALLF